ncbi:RNA pseudouridine synthase 3, mitochondrial [Quillaja saponaria]|uniref:RNA pseudouridine synthase 3, mitochondrial n=1 Tax=Quillaja saponaria TaxID=32244 RepID=A0AAD7LVV1_QUISA|nr:RNA pseudouridine synthase 3, mitochondrial [Quillaja saponaria]
MWSNNRCQRVLVAVRHYSRISPPRPVCVEPVIRVTNNVSHLDSPKEGPKPRQFLSLLSFPGHPLPGKNSDGVPGKHARVTAISWVKYYFDEIWEVQMEDQISDNSSIEKKGKTKSMRKIKPNEVMAAGAKVYVPVSIAETRISKRYDTVPSGTLYPNANEIEYLQGLVKYKVHRLDRESSSLMGRTKESVSYLQWLFSDINKAKSSC